MPPKKSKNDDLNFDEAGPFDIATSDCLMSWSAADDILDLLMGKIQEKLKYDEMMKKLPEYNVEYSLLISYEVNHVAIKSYDKKLDDEYI